MFGCMYVYSVTFLRRLWMDTSSIKICCGRCGMYVCSGRVEAEQPPVAELVACKLRTILQPTIMQRTTSRRRGVNILNTRNRNAGKCPSCGSEIYKTTRREIDRSGRRMWLITTKTCTNPGCRWTAEYWRRD